MAEPDNISQKAGEKRGAADKVEDKKPPKLRRFDMKTRVPRRDLKKAADDGIIGQPNSSRPKGSGEGATGQETMSVNAMFRTSFELQQADGSRAGDKESTKSQQSVEPGGGGDKNIVDQLFQDFVAIKMKEVDEAPSGEDSLQENNFAVDTEQDFAFSSIDEINRLLDAEITSIKSRSVVSNLYDDNSDDGNNGDVRKNISNQTHGGAQHFPGSAFTALDSDSERKMGVEDSSSSLSGAHADVVEESNTSPLDSAPSSGLKPKDGDGFIELKKVSSDVSGVFESCEEPVSAMPAKKPMIGMKKMGLSIGLESLARITGNWKNGKILEDGEVASTDSEAEKKSKADAEESADSENGMSETGSLSDSNWGKEDGKSKKKKKHKHKHRKKKKHKSHKDKDGKEKDSHSGRKSSKEKEEGKEPKSKDKKKHRSRSNSKSTSQRAKKLDNNSAVLPVPPVPPVPVESSSQGLIQDEAQQDEKPEENFDPWDARSYRTDGEKSPPSSSSRPKERSREGSKGRSGRRSKERSQDTSKDRSRGRSRDRSRDRDRKRRRSQDRHKDKDKEGRDKDPDLRVRIDKNKLRKIAIARALANMEKGQGPAVDLTTVKSGGKSVAELTEFCKRISQKEKIHGRYESSESDSSEDGQLSEVEEAPLHHPFKMRDPSTLPNIVMNIRNARQLPILSPQEKQTQSNQLRSLFPVSSGTQHRIKESEWVPVTPTTTATTTTKAKTTTAVATLAPTPSPALVNSGPAFGVGVGGGGGGGVGGGGGGGGGVPAAALPPLLAPVVTTPAAPAPLPPPPPPPPPPQHSVFPPPAPDINIGSIISDRIQAMRRLEENPYDVQALSSVRKINEQANQWAQSKQLPGQFTGKTDVRLLTQQELAGPDKRNQAWARKDQFRNAPPVQGGIGMFLLQKMGWKPGDGLGKDNEGQRLPLMLDIKMDRKGLTSSMEGRNHHGNQPGRPPPPAAAPRAKDLSGKHPVSALTELCTKRRWGPPSFDVVNEQGPAHKKMFLFKVVVNGVEYVPAAACGNKKLAKAQAAAVCLQTMGLIPRDYVVQL